MTRHDDIQSLIITHQRRLQKLKAQQAIKGINTPPEVLIEIEDIEAKLPQLQAESDALPEIVRLNPYRGLASFREEDADVFFGRENFTTHLVASVPKKSLVAVLGPSGSGKSSIVFAGLLPQLRRKRNWLVAAFRPGNDPFRALAAALLPWYKTDLDETDQMVQIPKLAAYLRDGSLSLNEVIAHIFEKQGHVKGRLLLIADQFEELYTLTQDAESQRRFLMALLDALAANTTTAPTDWHLLLTLRADFLGQALLYAPFGTALQDKIELLVPMSRDELSMAIEKPAALRGVAFEPGLVDRILDDVSHEPGHLPLLEFALTTLWEQQAQGQMTHAAYEAVGRVAGALSGHAEQTFANLSEVEQAQVQRVFMRLVQPGEGTEDTRRLVPQAELGETLWQVAQQLADARLVVTDRGADPDGQATVEVAHEALLRGWARLRGWIEADRAFLTWQKRLRFALEQWQASEQDEGALLRGKLLAEAEGWLGERQDDLGQAERNFIQASAALWKREQQQDNENRRIRLVWEIVNQGAKGRNLSKVNLSGNNLGRANLSEADLSESNLSEADLSKADLSKADLSKANLRGANLNGANLSDTDLSGVDLSGANLIRANLSRADLRGANLYEANLRGTNLRGANLSGANLSGTNLSKIDLSGVDLREANLSGVDLLGAYLYEANLSGANLNGANLNGANLSGANLNGANLSGANLSGTYLSRANLSKIDLSGVDLRRVNLSGVDLREVNLSGVDLRGANLYEANLSGANLSGAYLSGANLSGANLSDADLSKATYNQFTKWPDGFNPSRAGARLEKNLEINSKTIDKDTP